jgi:hypothetical protein
LGVGKSGNKVGKVNFSAGVADIGVSNGNGGSATRTSKRSLLGATTGKAGASRSPLRDEEADADADADAELEVEAEAEIEDELEGAAGVMGKKASGGGGVRKEMEVEVDGETEADLLDAVDAAAEANSVVGEDE